MTKPLALKPEDIPSLSYDELLRHIRLSRTRSDSYLGLIKLMQKELAEREVTINYQCSHCGGTEFHEESARLSGSGLASVFDVGTVKLRLIICDRCHHTDVFRRTVGLDEQVLDFLVR